jgi:hypothetical protein
MNYDALLTSWKFKHLQKAALLALTLACFSVSQAQIDSTATSPEPVKQVETKLGTVQGAEISTPDEETIMAKRHSPRTASIRSAILPGLGQVYNKKYWKVPIIYGGFAVAGWYLRDNLQSIERYKNAIIAENDGDPNTVNDTGFNQDQLFKLVDRHKSWRDLSYIALAAIYILNIVDASVDAHLFYFDVSPDLSLGIDPYFSPNRMQGTGLTLTLKL